MIPVADPGRWFVRHRREVAAAQDEVLRSGQYILGPRVEAFEQAFARFCGVRHAVAVASGTDALALTLVALGAGGGEVITCAHAPVATVAAIRLAGAEPVLADLEPGSRCLDPDSAAGLIGPQTRAVVALHMYGHPADVAALRDLAADRGIAVLEDCAQAHGAAVGAAAVGSLGDAGAYSFYPTKNIGAMGDAGAVVTDDEGLALELRRLRQYGWDDERCARRDGYNSRMDELQAALLSLRLDHWEQDFARRQRIAASYSRALEGSRRLRAPAVAPGVTHAFHQYVVECAERDRLRQFLAGRGIGSALHYPLPIHRHPAYRGLRAGPLLQVERLYERMLSVPVYPELTSEEVARIADALRDA